ncbi:transcription initiation factor TFIID subunit 1-like [Zingiber officinale]|uniref:Uncharacterized protein n=1 Tax=Zingiber officinale TaxID=94328 RepID=A0A8J5M992_ZINOF|nr:transcription initiation factor TFIID subunit 1-like [Zingiber officinale]KAG6537047.1 hypothetical protein ZIOFF_002125 [Zingiber officinale]
MGRTLTGGSQPLLPPPHASVRTRHRGGLFTAADLAAAELLVHLSESSAEAASTVSSSASSSSSSSSPRSVNTRPPDASVLGRIDDEEEMGPWRRTKRYRPMTDLYAATRPVGGGGGGGGGGGEERQSSPHRRP